MKEKNLKPIHIANDIWFYSLKNKLEFTVYTENEVKLFSISKKKLLKSIICKQPTKK